MGKRLDLLLGRKTFRASKLRTQLSLTLSRLVVLKRIRYSRCHHARSDIAHAIGLGRHERAFARAEYVVKEQRMLDLLGVLEIYCQVLRDHASLLENSRVCSEEMREAIAGLVYASTRSEELPELLKVKTMFSMKFGADFVASAVNLRAGCGVSEQVVRLGSFDPGSVQDKLKVIREVAGEKGMTFQFDLVEKETTTTTTSGTASIAAEEEEEEEEEEVEAVEKKPPTCLKTTTYEYRDTAEAAQAAFESAAFAAAAARAAVELSTSRSHGKGSDDPRQHPFGKKGKETQIRCYEGGRRETHGNLSDDDDVDDMVVEDGVTGYDGDTNYWSRRPPLYSEEEDPRMRGGCDFSDDDAEDSLGIDRRGGRRSECEYLPAEKRPNSVRTRYLRTRTSKDVW